jgi:DNA-binding transcriptional MerR regulator
MLSIQQLSQEVSIGVDTLRIWERRYGFPCPTRDSRGHRRYPENQLEALRTVKKLQALGYRPSRIFAHSPEDRVRLLEEQNRPADPTLETEENLILSGSLSQLETRLRTYLQQKGLEALIFQRLLPITQMMDSHWNDGTLSIAREHLISDLISDLLKEQLQEPQPGSTILFLTLSGERHKLGLLMSAALFYLAGARCLLIQEELPLSEIPRSAQETNCAAVALSFSSHYPARQAKRDLANLRNALDPKIKLIAGGQALKNNFIMPGLILCTDLRKIPDIYRRELSG